MRNLFAAVLLTVVSLFGASVVSAQGTLTENSEVYVGYQFVRQNAELAVPSFHLDDRDSHGVNASFTGYLGDTVAGITGEFGANFNRNSDQTLLTGMAGLTLKARGTEKVQPFVRGLAGVARQKATSDLFNNVLSTSDVGFSFAAGAGLDVKVGDKVSLRLIQADYLQTRLFGQVQHNARFGAGIVF